MRKHSRAIEDYLKAIHVLEHEEGARVSTSAVAERLSVSAPAATTMLKKLAAQGLVRHERYRGVELTAEGRRAAVEVIRHHRLLEQYLAQRLGVAIDEVHAEAEQLEHALSEELEARIDRELGFPTHDPHGDPIPSADLTLPDTRLRTLDELAPGEQATVQRVPDRDRQLLRHLSSLGLLPGKAVKLVSAEPFGGPLLVLAGGVECAISRDLASLIGIG
jgi:DtxR family transcriptional regulator, Mn-dependent transcriptional regulator